LSIKAKLKYKRLTGLLCRFEAIYYGMTYYHHGNRLMVGLIYRHL